MTDEEEETEAAKRRHPSQQDVKRPSVLNDDQFRPHLRLIKGGKEDASD